MQNTSHTEPQLIVLVAGTLRGYLDCVDPLRDALVRPNLNVGVQVTVVTYDQTDCDHGGSTAGLAQPRRIDSDAASRYIFGDGVATIFAVEPFEARMSALRRFDAAKRKNYHPAAIRYHSQALLRFLALRHASPKDDAVVALVRSDAKLYGRWEVRSSSHDAMSSGRVSVVAELRDGTACDIQLGPNEILVPDSELHVRRCRV